MIPRRTKKPVTSVSSREIVSDLKKDLQSRSEVYQRYLQDHVLTTIDPVKDSEFLQSGWSDNQIINDQVARCVEDSFSFYLDLSRANWLVVKAAVSGEDVYINPAKLTLKIDGEIIGRQDLRYSEYHEYYFKIKKALRQKGEVVGILLRSDKSTKVIILKIVTYAELSLDNWNLTITELNLIKRDTNQLLRVLEWNKNPEYLMPADQRAKLLKKIVVSLIHPISDSTLIKKIVLRVIRPFTTPQVEFNKYLVDLLTLQSRRLDKLENFIMLLMKNKKKNG